MISPCPDTVQTTQDDLAELYDLSQRIDHLVMAQRSKGSSGDLLPAQLLSVHAIVCRLETAAQLLRNLSS